MPRRKSVVKGSRTPTSVRLNSTAVTALEFLQRAKPFQSQGDILREAICSFACTVREENQKLGKPVAAAPAVAQVSDIIRKRKGGKR
jgi:hypothetical protein